MVKKSRRRAPRPSKATTDNKPGRYAFLAGVVVAVVAGLFTLQLQESTVTLILALLGLIVGFLNVTARETNEFLLAGVALILLAVPSGLVSQIQAIGPYLEAILVNIATFVSFAVLVVALKAVKSLAEN